MKTAYTITPNDAFKSIEINFEGKPSEAVRDVLKAMRFRWHSVKKVWYGYKTAEEVKKAIENAENGKRPVSTCEKRIAKKANKYGVEVGDVFYMSWGYDQTQVDYFQVVSLCGEQSVRVVNVNPVILNVEADSPMSEHCTVKLTKEPMPVDTRSIFIKDSEKGDIKRLKDYGNSVCINIGDHCAHKLDHGEHRDFRSWWR